MLEIKGIYNTAYCFTPELEPVAAGQIRAVCNQPAFAESRIRIMPDVHADKGCTISTTMNIIDKVIPGMVSVVIGCGMKTVRLAEKEIDFDALETLIRRVIPGGRDIRPEPHPLNERIDLAELRCAQHRHAGRRHLRQYRHAG